MQDGLEDVEVMYVGCLPVELDPDEQDVRALTIMCIENLGLFQATCKHVKTAVWQLENVHGRAFFADLLAANWCGQKPHAKFAS